MCPPCKKTNFEELVFNFLKLRFFPCKAEQPLQGMELQEKRSTKRLKHTGNLFRKSIQLRGQGKAFYRQSMSEPSCARKETVDITILVTSRNGDRKIMQSIKITSRPPMRIRKWNQLSQFR